jgi:hypothetical protein
MGPGSAWDRLLSRLERLLLAPILAVAASVAERALRAGMRPGSGAEVQSGAHSE